MNPIKSIFFCNFVIMRSPFRSIYCVICTFLLHFLFFKLPLLAIKSQKEFSIERRIGIVIITKFIRNFINQQPILIAIFPHFLLIGSKPYLNILPG